MSKRLLSALLVAVLLCVTTPTHAQTTPTINLLLAGEPFGIAINNLGASLAKRTGYNFNIELVTYEDAHQLILQNSHDAQSSYDLVSVHSPWIAELAPSLLPLDKQVASSTTLHPDDFIPLALDQATSSVHLYGIPVETDATLLWLRRSILDKTHSHPPGTLSDLANLATQLSSAPQRFGICWPALRGAPLGLFMIQLFHSFNAPLLNSDNLPTLNTPAHLAAASYAHDLLPSSPPDTPLTAWELQTRSFTAGRCAISSDISSRDYLPEDDRFTAGDVSYLPMPPQAGNPSSLIDSWFLSIPANDNARTADAWAALESLTSLDTQTFVANNSAIAVSSRVSLLQDETLQANHPANAQLLAILKNHTYWQYPATPLFYKLSEAIGTDLHDMLLDNASPQDALDQLQQDTNTLR